MLSSYHWPDVKYAFEKTAKEKKNLKPKEMQNGIVGFPPTGVLSILSVRCSQHPAFLVALKDSTTDF
jgi:hypothetical protein